MCLPLRARVKDSAQSLEEHGVKSSLPSGHLRDIASLPKADRVKAAKEALENGGGKRAFRAAAEKAKEKRSHSVPNTKGHHMFTVILTAEKEPDGGVTFKPEITGEAARRSKPDLIPSARRLRRFSSPKVPLQTDPLCVHAVRSMC